LTKLNFETEEKRVKLFETNIFDGTPNGGAFFVLMFHPLNHPLPRPNYFAD